MKPRSALIALIVVLCAALPIGLPGEAVGDPPLPIYQDPSYSFGERAADLVARMTPQKRASQPTSSHAPAIPSLGVPAYGWWNEALHGINAAVATTRRATRSR